MQYMALIYAVEGYNENYEGDMMADYGQFNQDAVAAGVFKAGDALMPVSTASSVQVRGGLAHGPAMARRQAAVLGC